MPNTDSTKAAAPAADTRNQFDRDIEQRMARDKFLAATNAEMHGHGKTFDLAQAAVKLKEPRLWALSEGRFDLDAELAAAGWADPLPHLRD